MNSAVVVLVAVLCAMAEEQLDSNNNDGRVRVRVMKEQLTEVVEEVDTDSMLHIRTVVGSDEVRVVEELKVTDLLHSAEEVKVGDDEVKVDVDTTRIINVVEDFFVSFNIDSYIFEWNVQWLKFNFSSPKIYTLLASLSPALLRIGGSPADWLFFNKPFEVLSKLHLRPNSVVMTKSDIVNLVALTRATGNRLLFDLNLQLRYGQQWDPSNAIELLEFCSEMGFGDNMDWELGNEPQYNPGIGQAVLSPKQIGEDFVILHNLLQAYPNFKNSWIVGPDVVGTTPGSEGLKIAQGLANATGSFLKAITFHHYYFEGDKGTYKDYLNPAHFADLAGCIGNVRESVEHSKYPKLPLWLGETSDAWHSGTENVSDRFVSGFLWLDKLGLSAQLGVNVVMRQTLYAYFYSLLDINMDPNPDFWLSWLHRVLVGNEVLAVTLSGMRNNSAPTTRVYAHCTNAKRSGIYKRGSVTVFGLNIHPNASATLAFTGSLAAQRIDAYLLEADGPDGVLSKWVKLNGKRLQMPSDILMPDINPSKLPPGAKVVLPPLTFGFFVFPDANAGICQ
jgi:heparanase